jgi:hypothetical protein
MPLLKVGYGAIWKKSPLVVLVVISDFLITIIAKYFCCALPVVLESSLPFFVILIDSPFKYLCHLHLYDTQRLVTVWAFSRGFKIGYYCRSPRKGLITQ